jgi:hypothetical protein
MCRQAPLVFAVPGGRAIQGRGTFPHHYFLFAAGDASVMSRMVMTQNPLQVLPHPFTEGGCLLAVGIGSPSLMLLELVAKVDPQVVHKAAMPDHMPLLGMGVLQVRHCEI